MCFSWGVINISSELDSTVNGMRRIHSGLRKSNTVIFLIQCALFHSEKNIVVFIVAVVTTGRHCCIEQRD